MKTQGEIEASICEGISRFEQEYMGRGPKDIRAHLVDDILFVRLQGVLTAAEQHLVKSLPAEKGRDLLKQVRTHLLETARSLLEAMVLEVTGMKVISMHHDISTVTGEEVMLFTLANAPVPRNEEEAGRLKRERGSVSSGAGIIVASNHADETDLKVCLESARRLSPPVPFHGEPRGVRRGLRNRGLVARAPWCFSVERGGNNEVAKRYAIDVVKRGREVLVSFPEGEIYYLNDLVQPFKSGVIEIGMQALVEMRQEKPEWKNSSQAGA